MKLPLAFTMLGAVALSACAPYQNAEAAVETGAATALDGAVSSADPRATAAGEAMLEKGGSATDAGIAVMLALTVVEPQSSGIGGGGFMVRASDEGIITYDGRETAPATATGTRFLDEDGERLPFEKRVLSGLSVGVPGNIALAAKAHAEHGKLPWADLFQPAIALARDGFRVNRRLHESIKSRAERAGNSDAARAIYFGPDGEALPVGSVIKVPALAKTFEMLAKDGPSAMYEAQAAALASYIAGETPQDGKMSESDITSYAAKKRAPVCYSYRAYTVCGMGPPSSGGVAVAQMLGQLERFDLAEMGPESAEFWHVFLESQRIAYADREMYIGDADFVAVPVEGLLDRDYVASRSALIDPTKALDKAEAGTPPGAPLARADGDEPPENGTTHFSVTDSDGNAISYTSTIEGAWGSGLFFEGFFLNNELTDFSLSPEMDGKPVANRVEGGKRPRSSMAPTIVFDDRGEVVLVIGAAGGPTIPVQVTRSIIGVIDFGMTAEEALAMPLLMSFGSVAITEKGSVVEDLVEELQSRGHGDIRLLSPRGKANALRRTPTGWEVASDPRVAPLLSYEPVSQSDDGAGDIP
ncbi:gamma-glutamyltransferase [Erythrobacter sp. YT30]|uniref:gamma-glutamyltransferase n=1 Tax=Erythrobacter sp. YT30 TaxID=1735012 RepID=UPI00076C732D|nr:gamma-glutamyltransferase [Erythrobacter sp. YT30]KWV92305.1 gamma-glutamyltranspeptidase [Erythrobacter sp. YT30]